MKGIWSRKLSTESYQGVADYQSLGKGMYYEWLCELIRLFMQY